MGCRQCSQVRFQKCGGCDKHPPPRDMFLRNQITCQIGEHQRHCRHTSISGTESGMMGRECEMRKIKAFSREGIAHMNVLLMEGRASSKSLKTSVWLECRQQLIKWAGKGPERCRFLSDVAMAVSFQREGGPAMRTRWWKEWREAENSEWWGRTKWQHWEQGRPCGNEGLASGSNPLFL